MELIETESKAGYYYTFVGEDGQTYLVLEGLDPSMVHTPQAVESFMLAHYDFFALAYSGLLLATFVYLAGTYLIIPLYLRWKQGLPFFGEQ